MGSQIDKSRDPQPQLFQPDLRVTEELQHRFQVVQVGLGLAQELAWFYASPQWHRATRVLDVGCGSGEYLRQLSERFPDKQYVGVDHNEALIARARDSHGAARRTFLHGDYADVGGTYDFVVARLFIQYLADLDNFLSTVARLLPHGSLFIVDADDRKRFFLPPVPTLSAVFEAYRERQRVLGFDRDRIMALAGRATAGAHFVVGMQEEMLLPSTVGRNRDLFGEAYRLMLDLSDASGLGLPGTAEARAGWDAWIRGPRPYTQIGLVGLRLDRTAR